MRSSLPLRADLFAGAAAFGVAVVAALVVAQAACPRPSDPRAPATPGPEAGAGDPPDVADPDPPSDPDDLPLDPEIPAAPDTLGSLGDGIEDDAAAALPVRGSAVAADTLIAEGAEWWFRCPEEDPGDGWPAVSGSSLSEASGWIRGRAPFRLEPMDARERAGAADRIVADVKPAGTTIRHRPDGAAGEGSGAVVCRFATTFDLPDPDAAVALRADLRFVAGAVAWVNGAERFRTNVPAGGEGLRRPAGEEETPYWIRRTYDGRLHRSFAGLDPGGLRVRGNVVAVQVHGTAGGGDDSLRFDMRLGVHRTRALETAPYLQPLPPDGAIVRFDTSGPAVARVRYGTGLEPDREAIATEGACAASHTARLGPIDPGVEVGYRVEWCACGAERGFSDAASCGASASYRFRSAPGPGESFVVAAYGDSRGYPARHRRVIEAMLPEALAAGASLLVHTGDVTDHGHPAQEWIDQFFGPAAEMLARMPAIAVLGNHDQLAEDWHERFDFPGNGSWFRLRFGDAEFFALNAYARLYRSGSEQLAWLDEALGSSDAPWKIVVTHQPLSTCMGDAERRRESRLARSVLGPILSRHGVRLLLAGHDHLYGRSRETDGFTMVVTGGGGAGTYPVRADADMAVCESIHHFVILRVSPQAIEGRAVRVDGTLLDEFRIDR